MAKTKELSRPAAKSVRFSVRLPQADEACVTGDFTRWDPEGIPLHHSGGDEWHTTLALPPGVYEYRLRVDGEWRDDPAAVRRVPNPYGSENGVLVVNP